MLREKIILVMTSHMSVCKVHHEEMKLAKQMVLHTTKDDKKFSSLLGKTYINYQTGVSTHIVDSTTQAYSYCHF